MDDIRVGRAVRALRRRLEWRQSDLAARAGVSQQCVSLVERGQIEAVSLRKLRAVLQALDARASIDVSWRGGELDRLTDRGHAALVATLVAWLRRAGWETAIEVTYAVFGERGSIDVLAWRGVERSLLVVEVKTDIISIEATARRHDEKVRLGSRVALDRFGWRAAHTSRLIALPDARTARRRLALEPLATTYPTRGIQLRKWLLQPSGPVAAAIFLPPTSVRSPCRRIDRPRAKQAQAGRSIEVDGTSPMALAPPVR